jgi:hypothetical protein
LVPEGGAFANLPLSGATLSPTLIGTLVAGPLADTTLPTSVALAEAAARGVQPEAAAGTAVSGEAATPSAPSGGSLQGRAPAASSNGDEANPDPRAVVQATTEDNPDSSLGIPADEESRNLKLYRRTEPPPQATPQSRLEPLPSLPDRFLVVLTDPTELSAGEIADADPEFGLVGWVESSSPTTGALEPRACAEGLSTSVGLEDSTFPTFEVLSPDLVRRVSSALDAAASSEPADAVFQPPLTWVEKRFGLLDAGVLFALCLCVRERKKQIAVPPQVAVLKGST